MSDPARAPEGDPSKRRTHYRIEYPVLDRPAFRAGDIEGLVNDCSETGVRVTVTGALPVDRTLGAGDRLAGTIHFSRGEMVDVEGEVMRFENKMLILHLDAATIPFGKIIREQWWLRSRYPWRDRR